MSVAKVGDACLYCPGCNLKSFRIDDEEWIVKCESQDCMYPIAITKEQCFSCREQVIETDTLDNFLEEIFTDSTEQMTVEETTNTQFIELQPFNPSTSPTCLVSTSPSAQYPSQLYGLESSPDHSQVQIPLDSFQNAFKGTFGVATHPAQITEPQPSEYKFTSMFQVAGPDHKLTTSQIHVVEPKHTLPPVQIVNSPERKHKITSTMKHLEHTKTLSTSNSGGSTPKRIKTGQIIRRLIKREPSGSEQPRETVQKVTHMKPLDYVKYFMEQSRNS